MTSIPPHNPPAPKKTKLKNTAFLQMSVCLHLTIEINTGEEMKKQQKKKNISGRLVGAEMKAKSCTARRQSCVSANLKTFGARGRLKGEATLGNTVRW